MYPLAIITKILVVYFGFCAYLLYEKAQKSALFHIEASSTNIYTYQFFVLFFNNGSLCIGSIHWTYASENPLMDNSNRHCEPPYGRSLWTVRFVLNLPFLKWLHSLLCSIPMLCPMNIWPSTASEYINFGFHPCWIYLHTFSAQKKEHT